MSEFTFQLDAKAIPQGRPRCACRGKIPRIYDPAKSRAYKAALVAAMKIAARKQKWKAPGPDERLWCSMSFQFTGAPMADLDNLAKPLLDAAQKAGILGNDNRVVSLAVFKDEFYPSDRIEFSLGVI